VFCEMTLSCIWLSHLWSIFFTDALYCMTPALDRYPLNLDKTLTLGQ